MSSTCTGHLLPWTGHRGGGGGGEVPTPLLAIPNLRLQCGPGFFCGLVICQAAKMSPAFMQSVLCLLLYMYYAPFPKILVNMLLF